MVDGLLDEDCNESGCVCGCVVVRKCEFDAAVEWGDGDEDGVDAGEEKIVVFIVICAVEEDSVSLCAAATYVCDKSDPVVTLQVPINMHGGLDVPDGKTVVR